MLKRSLLLLFLCSTACTTVHSAYLSNLSHPERGARAIEARASKTVVFALNFSNDYVFEARERLYAQCPDGMVTGVLSTFETTSYLFVHTHEVRARGFCVTEPGGARMAEASR